MSFASSRRYRPSRGSSLNFPPNLFARSYEIVRRPEVLFRVAAFIVAVLANSELKEIWAELSPPQPNRPEDAEKVRYDALRTYFTTGMDSNRFDDAIKHALTPLEKNGLLKELKHKPDEGSQLKILVYP